MSQPSQPVIDASDVRQQLEKIIAHDLFRRSGRMGRFLRLAVESSLEGKAGDLKEYLIGVDVFDRTPDYDPRTDPIVRVEARRLRSKLKAYYDGDGRDDPIRIDFHSGSYAPCIRRCIEMAVPQASTIAVLPLANLSGDPQTEYFGDGLTEELIHALTKIPGLRVVAWDSASQMRGRQHDVEAIRTRLKAGAVLTGSVRIAGPRLRVRAQLIDTVTGVYLWSEVFDREMKDVFAIQEEIAEAIVRTLPVQMDGDPPASTEPRKRTSLTAYDLYLKGRHFLRTRTREGLQQSILCFEQGIAADENSALAYAGLADATSLLVDYGYIVAEEGMPRAKSAATRAIALAPDLAEAHVSLAFIRGLYDHEWEEAEYLYYHALALNPGYATAHQWLAVDHYALLGRFDEAMAESQLAEQFDPLSSIIREGTAYILMLSRRYEEAVVAYRRLAASDPGFYKAYTSMGRALSLQGKYAEALEMLEKGRSLAGDLPSVMGAIGHVQALAGNSREARNVLAQLEERAGRAVVPSNSLAIIYLGLGEHERALDWLETGYGRKELPLTALKVHPLYDPLRDDRRFQQLLQRLRLAE